MKDFFSPKVWAPNVAAPYTWQNTVHVFFFLLALREKPGGKESPSSNKRGLSLCGQMCCFWVTIGYPYLLWRS